MKRKQTQITICQCFHKAAPEATATRADDMEQVRENFGPHDTEANDAIKIVPGK